MTKRKVDIILGGQWGSEGKGNIVSKIADRYDLLIRTGGPNAGHQVKFENNSTFTFHHLPSGSLHNKKAPIYLCAGCVINPVKLLEEIASAGIPKTRIKIHPQAAIITEEHIEREKKLFAHIGSTSQGVGAATIQKILREDTGTALARDCEMLRPMVCDEVIPIIQEASNILLEGTQGTLLSLHHGDWPYVTSRDTTAAGFLSEAGLSPLWVRDIIMVVRSYPIRVQNPEGGTSGPMGIETTWEEVAAKIGENPVKLKERERTSTTKRQRRVAQFNYAYLKYATMLNGPNQIALTFADYLTKDELTYMVHTIEMVTGVPVRFISRGFGPQFVEER